MPSVQLETYLQARADGHSVEHASEQSGIGLVEARLHEADIESGDLKLPRARARARDDQPKEEAFMARDCETTISVNGGPEVPLSVAKEALDIVQGRSGAPSVAADELRLFIERIERLSEERKGIADDIAEVYSEAKAQGYDKPTMRRIIRLRGMDEHARMEAAALLETYADALGLQGALPL